MTAGDSFIFTLSIADGYQKGENFSVKADGERLELNSYGQYVYTVKKDTLISVEGVEATTFKAVVSGGENATVEAANGSDANRIAYNGSYHFTVKPNDYYEVTQVAVNGEVKEAVNGVYTCLLYTSRFQNRCIHPGSNGDIVRISRGKNRGAALPAAGSIR